MRDPARCPTRGEQARGCSGTTNRVIRTEENVVRLQSGYKSNRNGLGLPKTTTDDNGQRLERGSIQSEQDFAAILVFVFAVALSCGDHASALILWTMALLTPYYPAICSPS